MKSSANEAEADPEKFWGDLAREELHWFQPFDKVLEWKEPFAKWFVGGKTNVSYNCLDRTSDDRSRQNKAAIIWEGEPGDTRTLTYPQLHREVCKFANVLKQLGVKQGDVVSIYMPMVPELAIAMLACARIGAVHSRDLRRLLGRSDRRSQQRRQGQGCHHGRRRLAARQAAAAQGKPSMRRWRSRRRSQKCVVFQRVGNDRHMQAGPRPLVARADGRRRRPIARPTPLDSEAPLFILYTSGSTGKPKGIKHTTAGYNLFVKKTFEWVFDHRDDDIFWCTADCGWVTGHSYVVYGPLSAGATVLMYEGAPNLPDEEPLLGASSRSTGSPSSTRPRRRFARSSSGAISTSRSTICRACGCWAPSAKGSIPKPGCGITARSAASAARSSIPGGRPKRAAS